MSLRRDWIPLSIVLLVGIAIGVVGMATWVHARLDDLHESEPAELEALTLEVLDRHLSLDAEQEHEALLILRRAHERFGEFHGEHGADLRSILTSAASELEGLLRPEQEVNWEEVHQKIVHHLLLSGTLGRERAHPRHVEGLEGEHGSGR